MRIEGKGCSKNSKCLKLTLFLIFVTHFYIGVKSSIEKISGSTKIERCESSGCAKIEVDIKNKTNLKCIEPDSTRFPTNMVVNSSTSVFFSCKTIGDRFMTSQYWKVYFRISYACSKRSEIFL